MSKELSEKVEICSFGKSDGCHALACYSIKIVIHEIKKEIPHIFQWTK